MKRNAQDITLSSRRVSRRGLILGGVQLGIGALVLGRMRYLQVDQADEFLLLAEENRIKVRLIAPERGVIYDRNGIELAGNEQIYRVSMIRQDADDADAVIANLRGLVKLDEEVLQRALREMDRRPHQSVTLADRLTWDELSMISVNVPALSGITPEVGLSRSYPMGPDYAHVIGYVGSVSERDIEDAENPDPLLLTPQFQIGKIGVEQRLEDDLRGRAGAMRVEQNAAGRIMRELGRTESGPGADVQLTIDAGLQNFTQARLGTESASAVVMDVLNGDIVAAVSSPSYDPNMFVSGISVPDYSGLRDNDRRPLHNKIVQGLYPPGSTFKMAVIMAAMEAEVITPDEQIYCGGYINVSNRRFHCWKRGGHGNVDMAKSLRESCDIYYYEMAQRTGIDNIARMARRLGLGIAHDIEMTSISEGLIPDRDWKRTRRGEDWYVGDSLNAAIGQGYVLTSPLQLAVMTARIASGLEVNPRMVRSVGGVARPSGVQGPLDLPRSWLDRARDGMFQVVNAPKGTAGGSKFDLAGMKWAGKTGTSQVRNITTAERAKGVISNEDLPWDRRDHALFVGYGPYENPRYSVSVVVEHGGGGSTVAAPIARDIMLYALNNGMPPLDAYPSRDREKVEGILSNLKLNPAISSRTAGTSEA